MSPSQGRRAKWAISSMVLMYICIGFKEMVLVTSVVILKPGGGDGASNMEEEGELISFVVSVCLFFFLEDLLTECLLFRVEEARRQ